MYKSFDPFFKAVTNSLRLLSTVYSFTKRRNKTGFSGFIKIPTLFDSYSFTQMCIILSDSLQSLISIYIYIYIYHHAVTLARISLTLSRHFFLSFIASGRSSGLHLVSSHSCCTYVLAGRPAFARPYVGVHKSTSLMSSSLLFQQCPACLVRLTWIVFLMGGKWPYSWCFVGCCVRTYSILLATTLKIYRAQPWRECLF